MSRRTFTYAAAVLSCGTFFAAQAPAALAATGGASAAAGSSARGGGSAPGRSPARAGTTGAGSERSSESAASSVGTVSASSGGITLTTSSVDMLRDNLTFQGNVAGVPAGTVVEVERRGRQTGGKWAPTARGTTDGQGNFTAVWPANHIGRFAFRAVPRSRAARSASSSPEVTAIVFRSSIATYYGPGFWGSRTACGQILRKSTIGVANRTLPCGTPVALLYRGHTLVVPVIDRGPYANGADWDLTEATATALGATDTVRLGAVSLPR